MAKITDFGKPQKDIDWIEKQVACLTRQGFEITEIQKRYPMCGSKIIKIRAKFGLSRRAQNLDGDRKYFNGSAYQEVKPFVNVQPKRSYL